MKIVLFLFIYFILLYFSFNKIQRKIIIFCISNYKLINNKLDLSSRSKLKILKKVIKLLIPLRNDIKFDLVTELSYLNLYLSKLNNKLFLNFFDKIYWNDIFLKNNINTPKLIAYNYKNNIYCDNYNNNLNYLKKPIFGSQGSNIEKIKGTEINEYLKNENTMIQELLIDCIAKSARHFRFISLYNEKKVSLWELKNNNSVVSNHASGGKVNLCFSFICNNLIDNEQKEINDMMNKLILLHKNYYNDVFSIGWDIMLQCENENNITAYCLEGNLLHSNYFYPENTPMELRNYILKEFKIFLEEKNIHF